MDEKDIHLLISKKYNVEINLNDHRFQYFLGSSYIQGSEIPKDILKGMKLLKLSSDLGNDYAQNALGLIYELGNEIVKINKSKAFSFFKLASEQGNKFSLYSLGFIT